MTNPNPLIKTIEHFRSQMVETCSRLLQIPSVNGINDEVDLAQAVAQIGRNLGLYVQIVGKDKRRPNVIVSTSETGKTGLLLIAHLDTVAPGDPTHWNYPPFSGKVVNDRIYGRGAIDTKGGITSALYALAALASHPEVLTSGRVQLICVPDEESGATGELGIKFLHAEGLLEAIGAIYAYSGQHISLGHRGVDRYRVICTGQSAHTGSRDWQEKTAGVHAVMGMIRFLARIDDIVTPYSKKPYFDRYRTVIIPGTMIAGGTSINMVPDHCEAYIDVRTIPDFGQEQVEKLLEVHLQQVQTDYPGIKFAYELLNHIPPALSDENSPIISILSSVIQEVMAVIPEKRVAGPANEGYLLIERGIPTVCGLGPTGSGAHSANEYVEIQGLVDAATIFALTASKLSNYVD